ncbi:MAG: hypothetical protein WKF96_16235 [Solirubrobacteraceae bacterium]
MSTERLPSEYARCPNNDVVPAGNRHEVTTSTAADERRDDAIPRL